MKRGIFMSQAMSTSAVDKPRLGYSTLPCCAQLHSPASESAAVAHHHTPPAPHLRWSCILALFLCHPPLAPRSSFLRFMPPRPCPAFQFPPSRAVLACFRCLRCFASAFLGCALVTPPSVWLFLSCLHCRLRSSCVPCCDSLFAPSLPPPPPCCREAIRILTLRWKPHWLFPLHF